MHMYVHSTLCQVFDVSVLVELCYLKFIPSFATIILLLVLWFCFFRFCVYEANLSNEFYGPIYICIHVFLGP